MLSNLFDGQENSKRCCWRTLSDIDAVQLKKYTNKTMITTTTQVVVEIIVLGVLFV